MKYYPKHLAAIFSCSALLLAACGNEDTDINQETSMDTEPAQTLDRYEAPDAVSPQPNLAGEPGIADPNSTSNPTERGVTGDNAVNVRGGNETTAFAELSAASGSDVAGNVEFLSQDDQVRMTVFITGLTAGQHAIHVHENGSCAGPDASGAGGHFSPDNDPHGAITDPEDERHAGDLGNFVADESGSATFEKFDDVITLTGPDAIVGKAIVVHRGSDDFTTQPSGDAGERVACGVIQIGS